MNQQSLAEKIMELPDLHPSFAKRRCYTNGSIIKNGKADGEDISLNKMQNTGLVRAFGNALQKAGHTASQGPVSGIVAMSNTVIMAGAPDAIFRDFVRIIETTEASVRFRLPSRGKAKATSRAQKSTSKGQRESYVTITCDQEHETSEEWDLNYIEDSPLDVLAEETAEVARATKEKESRYIYGQFLDITAADLAAGAEHTAATPGSTAWSDLVDMWASIKNQNYVPRKTGLNPLQAGDLWKDQKFLDQWMLGQYVDVESGQFGRSLLGFDILVSSILDDGTVIMADSMAAIAYGLRRDLLTRPYEIPPNKTGVQVSIRYGSQNGRTQAVARMTDG